MESVDVARLASAFFERAQVGMAIVCLEEPGNPSSLRIVALNPAAAQHSNVPTAAAGKRIDTDYPEIAGTAFPALVNDVLQSGEARDLGEGPSVYAPDRIVRVKAFPIPPTCVGLVFEDVTEARHSERALRETEQRYRKIFEASSAAICVFDAGTGALLDGNPRFVDMLGLGSAAQLIGKQIGTFGMWAEEGEYAALLTQLEQQRSIREAIVTYRTFGGQVRRSLVALELIAIEGQDRVLGLFWRA